MLAYPFGDCRKSLIPIATSLKIRMLATGYLVPASNEPSGLRFTYYIIKHRDKIYKKNNLEDSWENVSRET